MGGPVVQTVTITEGGANAPTDWNLQLADDARGAAGRRRLLEGLHPEQCRTCRNLPQYHEPRAAVLRPGPAPTTTRGNPDILPMTDHVLPYFPNFRDPSSPLYDARVRARPSRASS